MLACTAFAKYNLSSYPNVTTWLAGVTQREGLRHRQGVTADVELAKNYVTVYPRVGRPRVREALLGGRVVVTSNVHDRAEDRR